MIAIVTVWIVTSLVGFIRQLITLYDAYLDLKALGDDANGRRIIADDQVEAAWQHTAIQGLFLSAGIVAFAHAYGYMELAWRLEAVPLLLIFAQLIAVLRHERAAHMRRRLLSGRAPMTACTVDDVLETVHETREDVKDIKQEGVRLREERESDRPEEEDDRQGGRDHRGYQSR